MKKLLLFLLLCNLSAFSQTVHRNIFTPGADMWMPPDVSFNTYYGIKPGDTVKIKAGTYGISNIYKAEGIVFQNEGGQVTFKYFSLYNSTKDIQILGNGHPGTQYGIKFSSTTNFGSLCETTGQLTIKNVHVSGSTLGIQVGHHPSKVYAAPALNLTIENCLIENVGMEGLYIGHDVIGGPYITAKIWNNIIRNTGRDGGQFRNGTFNVDGNWLENLGLNGEEYHAHGLLLGPGVNGSITNNTVINAKGYGAFFNNRGRVIIKGNKFQSSLAAIFIKNYEQDYPYQTERFMVFDISGNSLTAANGKAIEVLFDPAKDPITVNFSTNTYTGSLAYQTGVIFNKEEIKLKTILWTAYKVIDGKRKYYNVFSDFTWAWK